MLGRREVCQSPRCSDPRRTLVRLSLQGIYSSAVSPSFSPKAAPSGRGIFQAGSMSSLGSVGPWTPHCPD
ncbi:hypothetical protein LEMLEM_LOCUS4762 [Lemmus lemmus]